MRKTLIFTTLLSLFSLSAQAQRVVTILEFDDQAVGQKQMQDPRTLAEQAIATDTFSADGLFHFNKATIKNLDYRQEDFSKLANVAIQGGYFVRVDAFADEIGSQAYNKSLSQKRAKAVMQHLVKHYRVAPSKITYTGWGENYPIVQCDISALRYERAETIACLAPNRRVTVSVIKGD